MKQMKLYIYLALAGCMAASCSKDFLQRTPKTAITEEAFFNTPKDLETYSNSFYEQLRYATDDINSDNISSYSGSGEVDLLVRGNITPETVGGWNDWDKLRNINFMLDNAGKATGDMAAINHYIGVARFFRAWFYYDKVLRYSNVPWYSHALAANDSALFKPADPRALVADSIMADLQYAVDNIKPDEGNRTRVTKWAALALLSRFCLFEGTFRKYHSELKLGDTYKPFLEKSVWAAEQLVASGRFAIHNTGKGAEDYRALFVSLTLNGNKEMIQWKDFQQSLNVGNNTHAVLGWTWSLSQSLANSYLMKDGTPFTAVPGHEKMTFVQMFANRDPRLAETIAPPGFSPNQDGKPYIPKPNLGGYDQVKFFPRSPAQRQGWDADFSGLPVFRYAEALLNLAEAKAELGTLTQADVNNTVNQLRRRVQMPDLDMTKANASPDPVLAAAYTNVSGAAKGVLLEIRRERRVELACEGRRFEDVTRWAAGMRLQDAQQGMYVPALGGLDVSGDGREDIAILASPSEEGPIAGLPADVKANLAKFYLKDKDGKDNNFYLEKGTSGHIMFTRDRDNPRVFVEPKHYYRPIPLNQVILNGNLEQPFGW